MRRGGEAEQVGQHSYGLLRISMGVRRGAGLRSHLLTVLHAKLLPKGEEAQHVGMWGGKLPGQKQFLSRHIVAGQTACADHALGTAALPGQTRWGLEGHSQVGQDRSPDSGSFDACCCGLCASICLQQGMKGASD